jgi:hypothetical protein
MDLAAVLLFVVIGRSAHTHGLRPAGVLSTAWPFLVGLALGSIAVGVWRSTSISVLSGCSVAGVTVAVGMTLRVISGQGTAVAFIAVALGFLGATMVGWRMVVAGLLRRWGSSRAS